jgi:fused signal recognition particle receptor
MFKSLKDKLKKFKSSAEKELVESDEKTAKKGDKKAKKPAKVSKVKGGKKGIVRKRAGGKTGIEKLDKDEWAEVEKKPLLEDVEGGFLAKKITDKKLDDITWELEVALHESDVASTVIDEIKIYLEKELAGKKIKRSLEVGDVIETALKNAISNVLVSKYINFDKFIIDHKKPVILMFVGVNGTGKTTAIAKIVHRLKGMKKSCVIAASDTFRAGAIEQLEKHANRLGIKLIKHQAGSDPAAIAYDAIEHAKARKKDVVLIDTAGRMQTNVNLMDEMKKIKRVAKPDMIIFVGDSLAGNDAVEQAIKFNDAVEINAAILTKIDADAKGGAALSIAHAVGKPILFVGIGQEYEDLVPFNPEWMVQRLFE